MVWGFITAAASIYGAYQASEAADQAGRARADALRRQAEFLRKQALFAEEVGNIRKMQFERQATQFRSSQRGMFAKAGVDISGSVLNVLGETSGRIEQQMHMIEHATNNEILFANTKRNESLLTADAAMAAIPYQQSAAWAQGIAGAAVGLSKTKIPWGKFGSGLMSATSEFGSIMGEFGTSMWDATTMRPGTRMGTGYRG